MSEACPVCGDPNAWPGWIGEGKPDACPHDMPWHKGGARTVLSVTDCQYQMRKAWVHAERRRLCPDAFDASGALLPGEIGRVMAAFVREHPNYDPVFGEPLPPSVTEGKP